MTRDATAMLGRNVAVTRMALFLAGMAELHSDLSFGWPLTRGELIEAKVFFMGTEVISGTLTEVRTAGRAGAAWALPHSTLLGAGEC